MTRQPKRMAGWFVVALFGLVSVAAAGLLAQGTSFLSKVYLGSGACLLQTGSGTPESAVTGSICDLFFRTNGSAGTTVYIKESGTATNTGWVAQQSASAIAWASMAHGSLTFSANGSMSWTVDSGDLSYYRYAIVGKVVHIRGSIVSTDVGGTANTELRVSAPTGVTFATNDAVAASVYTDAGGFTTQDVGQVFARVSGNVIAFKKRDGSNWTLTTGDDTGVIFSITAEQ